MTICMLSLILNFVAVFAFCAFQGFCAFQALWQPVFSCITWMHKLVSFAKSGFLQFVSTQIESEMSNLILGIECQIFVVKSDGLTNQVLDMIWQESEMIQSKEINQFCWKVDSSDVVTYANSLLSMYWKYKNVINNNKLKMHPTGVPKK